jgi:hypothetical protein
LAQQPARDVIEAHETIAVQVQSLVGRIQPGQHDECVIQADETIVVYVAVTRVPVTIRVAVLLAIAASGTRARAVRDCRTVVEGVWHSVVIAIRSRVGVAHVADSVPILVTLPGIHRDRAVIDSVVRAVTVRVGKKRIRIAEIFITVMKRIQVRVDEERVCPDARLESIRQAVVVIV